MIDEIPDVARSIAELRKFMDGFVRALDALGENVSAAAPDEVRAFLPLYALIVPVFDERLVRCADLLGRGLRDEALGYEADVPPVLDAVTLLDLASKPQWEAWKGAMEAHDFPLPTMPRMDLAGALFDARNTLIDLKPLLDRWRRLNLSNAPLPERLRMLRLLRQKDSNNEVWFESLVEHEKQRLMEIERDIKAAISAKDEAALAVIVAELAENWVEPPPGRIKLAATSALEGFKSSRVDRQMDEVGRNLAAAYEAKDLDAGRQLRRQWAALLEEKGAAAAGDPRVADAEPATTWVDRHDRLESLSAEIWQSLDAEPSGFRARRQWARSLERMGQEIEDLSEKLHDDIDIAPVERALERISRVLEAFDREERFRRRIMFAGVGVAALLVAGVVIGRQVMLSHEQRVLDAIAEIDKQEARIRAGEIEPLDDVANKLQPSILADPRFAGKLALARGELQKQDERRRRLATGLEEIEKSVRAVETAHQSRKDPLQPWPAEFAAASRRLADVERAGEAVTAAEQAKLVEVRGDLDIAKTRFHGEADAHVESEIREINARVVELRELVNKDRAALIKGVEEQRTRFLDLHRRASAQAAPEADGTYENLRTTSAKVRALIAEDGIVAKQLGELDALAAKWEAFEKALALLDDKLGDWPAYAAQLRAIASGFPDIPEARDYGSCAGAEPMWVAADQWNRLTKTFQPLRNATAAQAQALLEGINALQGAAAEFAPARDFKTQFAAVIQMLATRKPAEVRNAIRTFLDGVWLAELKSLVTVEGDADGFYCIDVPAEGAFFKYVSGWKGGGGWPLKQSGAAAAAVKPAPQLAMRDKLNAMLKLWQAQPEGLQFDQKVVDLLEAVIVQKEVDPILLVVTLRQIFLAARDHSRVLQCPQAVALQDVLKNDRAPDEVIPGIPKEDLKLWVRHDRDILPGYVHAAGKAKEILVQALDAIPHMRQALANEQALLASVAGERLELVGRTGRDAKGLGTAVVRGKAVAGDLWWVDRAGGLKPGGTIDVTGRFTPTRPPAPAGSPLYRKERFGAPAKPQAAGGKAETQEKRGA